MATKKPSAASQLKAANIEITALKASVTDITSKLTSATSSKEYYQRQQKEAEDELNQLHGLLDAFQGSLPRKSDETYNAVTYSAMTRLASWLAANKSA